MKIGSLTTGNGVVTTFQLTYLPEFLAFSPTTAISKVVVNVLGDGIICDLDAAGISQLGNLETIGSVTNLVSLRLADGIVLNKNVTIEITNSAAQTPDIFAYSVSKGGVYVQSIRQTAFANSGIEIKNFLNVGFSNAGATDDFQVSFVDGTTQKMNREELKFLFAYENSVKNTSADYLLRNYMGNVLLVNYTPSAQTVIYVQRMAGTKNVVLNSSVN